MLSIPRLRAPALSIKRSNAASLVPSHSVVRTPSSAMARSVLTPVCCGLHSNVGASRGFAFVEFVALEDAVRWMEAKQVMRVIHPVDRPWPHRNERERQRESDLKDT